MQHPVQMHTAVGKGLVNRLCDEIGRIVLMQVQNAHKLLYATSIRPFLFEVSKHAMVGLRPILAPPTKWFCILKCTWPLLKQRKIVERIKNILLALIATGMTGNEVCFVKDVNL